MGSKGIARLQIRIYIDFVELNWPCSSYIFGVFLVLIATLERESTDMIDCKESSLKEKLKGAFGLISGSWKVSIVGRGSFCSVQFG